MDLPRYTTAMLLAALAAGWVAAAGAHTFPQQEEPGVGAVAHHAPKRVSIWFDGKVEPVFSTVVVKDSGGTTVSAESRVDDPSHQRLEADLPPLGPGQYHVYWKVVSVDGHASEGDYVFTVGP